MDPQTIYQKISELKYSKYYIYRVFWAFKTFESTMLPSKKFHTWMKENPHLFRNSYPAIRKAVQKEDVERALLVAYHLADPRLYNLLVLMCYAGFRITEARFARWTDYQKEEKRIWVVGKGDKEASVPLHVELKATDDEFIAGRQVKYTAFFKKHFPGFSPKSLRAYFITTLANSNFNLKEVSELARHSNIQTTSLYVRTDQKKMSDKIVTGGLFHDPKEIYRGNEQTYQVVF